MTLLAQFLIVSVFPLAFLGMAFYVARVGAVARRAGVWWSLLLIAAAIWASHLLSAYLGVNFSPWVPYYWRLAGRYALSLTGTLFLLTSLAFLRQTTPRLGWAPWLSLGLWAIPIGLDPAIWGYNVIPSLTIAGRTIQQFDWWGIAWVASWVIPTLLAWLQMERANRTVPSSLFRNQVGFWFLNTNLFLLGAGLGLARDSLTLQQMGAVLLLLASFLGTFSITRTYLPDIGQFMRQAVLMVVRSLLIFALILAGMLLLFEYGWTDSAVNRQALGVFTAAFFALAILLVMAATDIIATRLRRTRQVATAEAIEQQLDLGNSLLAPPELADLFVQWVQASLHLEGGWVMATADAPHGHLLYTPLSSHAPSAGASTADDSPFTDYLRRNHTPLTQQDIDSLTLFSQMLSEERDTITAWQCALFMPIHAGQRLVALAGLPPKQDYEPYTRSEWMLLGEQAAKFGHLLVQSQALHALQAAHHHTLRHNRELAQENRRLVELVALHRQFTALMSPTLRKPFNDLELQLVKVQGQAEGTAVVQPLTQLQTTTSDARALVDNLITVAGRLEKQTTFTLTPVYLDAVVRTAMKSLQPMAEARRNTMEFEVRGKLLPVFGDEQRLTEAVQQLLHNALKYNKLNHIVQLVCEMRLHEVRLQIIDFGVGIPPNKLDEIWQGLTQLQGETNAKRRHTRLGLALARFIVQSHGGRIEVASTYGSGSTFTISLPALVEE